MIHNTTLHIVQSYAKNVPLLMKFFDKIVLFLEDENNKYMKSPKTTDLFFIDCSTI